MSFGWILSAKGMVSGLLLLPAAVGIRMPSTNHGLGWMRLYSAEGPTVSFPCPLGFFGPSQDHSAYQTIDSSDSPTAPFANLEDKGQAAPRGY